MPDATERRALFTCAILAGSVLLAPGERISAGIAFALGAALFAGHVVVSRKEAAEARPVQPAASPPGAAPPGAAAT